MTHLCRSNHHAILFTTELATPFASSSTLCNRHLVCHRLYRLSYLLFYVLLALYKAPEITIEQTPLSSSSEE